MSDVGFLLSDSLFFKTGDCVNVDVIYVHNSFPLECKISSDDKVEKIAVKDIKILTTKYCQYYEM